MYAPYLEQGLDVSVCACVIYNTCMALEGREGVISVVVLEPQTCVNISEDNSEGEAPQDINHWSVHDL